MALGTGADEWVFGDRISPHHDCAFILVSTIKQKSTRHFITKTDLFGKREGSQCNLVCASHMHELNHRKMEEVLYRGEGKVKGRDYRNQVVRPKLLMQSSSCRALMMTKSVRAPPQAPPISVQVKVSVINFNNGQSVMKLFAVMIISSRPRRSCFSHRHQRK